MEILDCWVWHGLLFAWCPRCSLWHRHGGKAGHRVAHCIVDPPPGGYMLRLVGPAPPEILADVRRRRPQGPDVVLALAGISAV